MVFIPGGDFSRGRTYDWPDTKLIWYPNPLKDDLPVRTHRVRLMESTRRDNAALFGHDPSKVPREALSMGIGTILHARRIVLVATGDKKAECIRQSVNGRITTRVPASMLQVHPDVEMLLDEEAAALI